MRITYVSQSVIPSRSANSIQVMGMSHALAQTGVKVELIAKTDNLNLSKREIFSTYGVQEIFKLVSIPSRFYLDNKYLYYLVASIIVLLSRSDLVYTRIPAVAAVLSLFGKRVIVELHHPTKGYRALNLYLRFARRPFIVVISEALRVKIIEDLSCDKNLVYVAHDAADGSKAHGAKSHSSKSSVRFKAGYLGHLYPGKGMEVISQIADRCPWCDFEIVGGKEEDIIYWRSECKNIGNVKFHGHVDHSNTNLYLEEFDVALLPNQEFVGASNTQNLNISPWTSPLKAFEYMAAGLPIIASDLDNLREIFVDGEDAILCSPTDYDAWVKALENLRYDVTLRKVLGNAALRKLQLKFSWDVRAKCILSKYNSVYQR